MNFKLKKKIFLDALEKMNLKNVFEVAAETDDYMVFQAEETINNSRCMISIHLQDNVYTTMTFHLAHLDDLSKREKMLDLLNEFNSTSALLKFYLNSKENILAKGVYMLDQDDFNAEFFLILVIHSLKLIEEEYYSQIMRLIWV